MQEMLKTNHKVNETSEAQDQRMASRSDQARYPSPPVIDIDKESWFDNNSEAGKFVISKVVHLHLQLVES